MPYNMDQSAELPFDLDQEFNDLLSILRDDIDDLTPPPSPSHPIVPAGMDGCTPPGAAPHRFEQPNTSMAPQRLNVGPAAPIVYQEPLNLVQPAPLYNQSCSYSQGQNLPIFYHVLSAAATGYPAAPPQPYNNVPVVQDLFQNLPIAGVLNGQVLYKLPDNGFSSFNSAAPPPNTVNTKKRKRKGQHHDAPYIKKPPNAFMLFVKEQRSNFEAENTSGTAVVNTILGQKWKSLSNDEQAKYYQQAYTERCLHAQRHPDWSTSYNYGVKRKRDRRQAAKMAEASTSGEVTQQAKKLCVVPLMLNVDGTMELLDDDDSFCPPPIPLPPWMESPDAPAQTTESKDLAEVGEVVPLMLNVDDMMELLDDDDDDSFCPLSIPLPPWMKSPSAPAKSGGLDLAERLEAHVYFRDPRPTILNFKSQTISSMDIFPEEDHTDVFTC